MPRLKKKYTESATVTPAPVPVVSYPPNFLNVHQAAAYYGVTVWTIRGLIEGGKIVAKKIGKRFVIRRADLDKYWQAA